MKKSCRKFLVPILCLFLVACAATAIYFSLDDSSVVHNSALITGVANYKTGYYLPTTSSVLEISLVRTFPAGNSYEISHSRIKNIQKFPVQFTLRYDSAEIDSNCSYRIDASFTSENSQNLKDSKPVTVFTTEVPITIDLM